MIDARELAGKYLHRMGHTYRTSLDASGQWQLLWLKETVTRLAVILEDEGVSDETAARVVRSLLYGAPTESEAALRMQKDDQLIQAMSRERTRLVFPEGWKP